MKALLIGNGAREHCIAEALAKDSEIYSLMSAKNPGVASFSTDFFIAPLIPDNALKCAVKWRPDIAVIGPEAPLAEGVADVLRKNGVLVVGPNKAGAMLETSKGFTRRLLEKYGIEANPKFKYFISLSGIRDYMQELKDYVLKPDGLTGGKGVKVKGDHFHSDDEGLDYCYEIISKGSSVVVEEKLEGEEFSLQCFVDGNHVVAMPDVQDHKRAFDGDSGSNTGGMGSYSFPDVLPFIDSRDLGDALRIVKATVNALKIEGVDYRGVIYGGFMATRDGVKLIEYNARFGDPEAMNVVPLIKESFSEVCADVASGKLSRVSFMKKATVCKYVVPEGYPENPAINCKFEVVDSGRQGVESSENDEEAVDGVSKVYYASVYESDGEIFTTSSRTAAFLGISNDISEAERIAQRGVESAVGKLFFRRDIGTHALIQKRVEHMKMLRGIVKENE